MISNQLFCGIFSLLLLTGSVAQAQAPARRPGGAVAKPRAAATGVGTKDGMVLHNGRVVLTELGTTNPLVADKKLINGTTITVAGLVTGTDGTTTQLIEGDYVSLTGRVTSRTSIVEADSLLKIKMFDLKYPGKRKKMEADRERKEKIKLKREEEKAKAKSKKKR